MATCQNCTSTNLVHVDMQLRGGPVRFAHCRRCEHRWWMDASGGSRLRLSDVLTKAAS